MGCALFYSLQFLKSKKKAGIDARRFMVYQMMYGVVNQCHFDYASIIWIELVQNGPREEEEGGDKEEGTLYSFCQIYQAVNTRLDGN